MTQKRRIVVGDIHGELEGFMEILKHAGLINYEGNWTGGGDILIQTGDVIDRGPHSVAATDLLRRLQKEAVRTEGEVVRLCGNHELMIMQGYYGFTNIDDPQSYADDLIEEIMGGFVVASYTDGKGFIHTQA